MLWRRVCARRAPGARPGITTTIWNYRLTICADNFGCLLRPAGHREARAARTRLCVRACLPASGCLPLKCGVAAFAARVQAFCACVRVCDPPSAPTSRAAVRAQARHRGRAPWRSRSPTGAQRQLRLSRQREARPGVPLNADELTPRHTPSCGNSPPPRRRFSSLQFFRARLHGL